MPLNDASFPARDPAPTSPLYPQRNPGVDVCVAVATDGGLLTPIVKGADALGLVAINEAVKDLAARARIGEWGWVGRIFGELDLERRLLSRISSFFTLFF